MKCNKKENCVAFTIDYKKKIAKFKTELFNKKVMSLKEFAIYFLGIDPISTEIIALYIGKMGFDTYNRGHYKITINKKIRNGIKGTIQIYENSK